MWPWEHLAVGYLAYSLVLRLTRGRRPTGPEAALVAVASQFPDLVDKPLAWGLDLLPSGLSLAHSLVFAVPTWVLAGLIAWRREAPGAALAVVVGYASHLAGDALYPVVYERPIRTAFLGWPLWPVPAESSAIGLVGNVTLYLDRMMALYGTPRGKVLAVLEVALLGGGLVIWLLDDTPGLRGLRRRVRSRFGSG